MKLLNLMILSIETINIEPFSKALKILVEVREIQLSTEDKPFEKKSSRIILDEAVEIFRQYVEDNEETENEIRRSLAWILNLDDDRLLILTLRIQMPFPNTNVHDRRRFLENLWEATFSSWRVKEFNPNDYDVQGMPPKEQWMEEVLKKDVFSFPSES